MTSLRQHDYGKAAQLLKQGDRAKKKGNCKAARQRQEERYSQSNMLEAEQPDKGKAAIQWPHSMTVAKHHEGGHAA